MHWGGGESSFFSKMLLSHLDRTDLQNIKQYNRPKKIKHEAVRINGHYMEHFCVSYTNYCNDRVLINLARIIPVATVLAL